MFRVLFVVAVLCQLFGCSPLYQVREINPETGLYPASVEFQKDNADIYKPFDKIDDVGFVYLVTNSGNEDQKYEDLHRATLADLGFERIINRDELSALIIGADLTSEVLSLSDIVSLNRASQILGPFLVVESFYYIVAGAVNELEFRVSYPTDGKTYFKFQDQRTIWLSHGDELVYPTQNLFKQWVDDSREMSASKVDEEEPKQEKPQRGI